MSFMWVVFIGDDSCYVYICVGYDLIDECGDISMGVDDNGVELVIERVMNVLCCSDVLERENWELFECEKGREWCLRDMLMVDKNVFC